MDVASRKAEGKPEGHQAPADGDRAVLGLIWRRSKVARLVTYGAGLGECSRVDGSSGALRRIIVEAMDGIFVVIRAGWSALPGSELWVIAKTDRRFTDILVFPRPHINGLRLPPARFSQLE